MGFVSLEDEDENEDDCLHCAMMGTISDWHEDNYGDDYEIDPFYVIQCLAKCMVDIATSFKDAEQRAVMRFAHDTLDAGLKFVLTGEQPEVEPVVEH